MAGKAVGAALEARVRRLLTAKDHGHGLRPGVRLRLEERVERLRARRGRLPRLAFQNIWSFEKCFHSSSALCIQRKKSKKSLSQTEAGHWENSIPIVSPKLMTVGLSKCCRSCRDRKSTRLNSSH